MLDPWPFGYLGTRPTTKPQQRLAKWIGVLPLEIKTFHVVAIALSQALCYRTEVVHRGSILDAAK